MGGDGWDSLPNNLSYVHRDGVLKFDGKRDTVYQAACPSREKTTVIVNLLLLQPHYLHGQWQCNVDASLAHMYNRYTRHCYLELLSRFPL